LIIRKTTTALALSLALAIPLAAQKTANQAEKQAPPEKVDAWFAKYDANHDGQLTVQEFRPGRTLFAALDVDTNGTVTRDEAIEALTPKADKKPTVDLKKLDTDGDGYVTRREWDGDQEGFDRLDADNDGVLSKQDRELVRSRARAEERLKAYDKNEDGFVSEDEWPGTPETFRQQDSNRNGKITVDELAAQ
jgi:Ca2+-binding EF-hand superfamily protein